ncbi:MAG: acetylglutamate kinase [Alphaproteobacteria bacterium GM202ARS2]|nr:acetylglutamate kinase [Alphaproteobacteria bacterium GM202ARS2]
MTVTPISPEKEAQVLANALPYMRKHKGANFVIKIGGSTMGNKQLIETFAKDIVLLKHIGIKPFVIHGGGPQIEAMLKKLKIKSEFINGLRITDQETVDIVEMVLAGNINKEIVAMIHQAGGRVIGLSGKDAQLIQAQKKAHTRSETDSHIENVLDLGLVGEPKAIDADILHVLGQSDIIPVIAPIGLGADGQTYNINADTAAGAIASSLKAQRLILMTDVEGVKDKDGHVLSELNAADAHRLIKQKVISGGMIPKVETCLKALDNGAHAAVIVDGRKPHALLLEIFTQHGAGTLIKKKT